jgi:hypothetical protein
MIMVRLLSTRAFMVGFGTTKLTWVWEPALLWNQLRSLTSGQNVKSLGHNSDDSEWAGECERLRCPLALAAS